MKTLSLFLAFFVGTAIVNAQEVIQLKEAKIGFNPAASEFTQDGNTFTLAVNELHKGDFEKDPIAFLNQNVDMESFLALVKDQKYEQYQVRLQSSKGTLQADFDRDGKLGATVERFENIAIPVPLMAQLLRDHEGWRMVKNVHITKGEKGRVAKEFYKIKLENGKQSKKIKIYVDSDRLVDVASN